MCLFLLLLLKVVNEPLDPKHSQAEPSKQTNFTQAGQGCFVGSRPTSATNSNCQFKSAGRCESRRLSLKDCRLDSAPDKSWWKGLPGANQALRGRGRPFQRSAPLITPGFGNDTGLLFCFRPLA